MTPRRHHEEAGQAVVELVALLPVVVAVGTAALAAWAVASAQSSAEAAAHAGAVALLQQRDPVAAGRAALSGGRRERARFEVRAGVVRVRLAVRVGVAPLAFATTVAGTAVAPGARRRAPHAAGTVRFTDGAASAPAAAARAVRRSAGARTGGGRPAEGGR